MRYEEITRFITAMERSGGDANVLRVERALKIAIPVDVHHHRAVRRPARHEHPAGRLGLRHRREPCDDDDLSPHDPADAARSAAKGVIPPDLAAWIPGAMFGVDRSRPAGAGPHLTRSARRSRSVEKPRPTRSFNARRSGSSGASRATGSTCSATSACARTSCATSRAAFGDPATYVPETIRQMKNIGVDSVPLTVIVAAFIGGVIALQTRYQLFPGVAAVDHRTRQPAHDHARARTAAHRARAHRARRRAHDRRDRNDARHRADRRARDARLRSGRVSDRAAAARRDR